MLPGSAVVFVAYYQKMKYVLGLLARAPVASYSRVCFIRKQLFTFVEVNKIDIY